MKKFTLIELLIVVAIIGILVSMLIPSLAKAREVTKRAVCSSNLSQISKAYQLYATQNSNFLISAETREYTNHAPAWVKHSAWNFEQNIQKSPLWPYINSVEVFQCSNEMRDDNLTNGNYLRSYAVNVFLNGRGWVNGIIDNIAKADYPTSTITFIDEEDPRGYNMNSWVAGYNNKWVDWPANNHGNKTMPLSFLDGHNTMYHFRNSTTSQINWFFDNTSYEDRLEFMRLTNPNID